MKYSAENPQVVRFDSWGSYLDYCDTATATMTRRSSRDRESGSWDGNVAWSGALELARNGWLEGAKRIEATSHKLEAKLIRNIVREEWNYSTDGDAWDIGRVLADEPEHWIKREEVEDSTGSRHVKITVDLAASGGVSSNMLEARGAAIVAAIELLEYAGYRCEVHVAFMVAARYKANPIYICTALLKAYDQPIDLPRLAFALAHAASLRRIGFSALECANRTITVELEGNYGYPSTPPESMTSDTDVFMSSAGLHDTDWENPECAERWIIQQLETQGISLINE